jgi:PEP-CTERM motif
MIAKMLAGVALLATASMAQAVTVQWAALNAQPDATTVTGTVAGVGLTYSGALSFAQINNNDTDFWVDNGYTQGVVNRPTGTDLIALNAGGTKTITFAAPVKDVYLAFASWNGVLANFSAPFTVVSQGCGYWGCSTFNPQPGNTSFYTTGEVHGVLKFAGTFTSLSFTDTAENWHGFTVGVDSLAPTNAVPEPASWAMLIAGFGLTGAAMRRRRTLSAA